ncbi:MAG: flavodoxin [Bacteroidales bacterium]|jgi:flavodoxin|nr:flavodoxin [Bacteroidales bacterium]
MRTTILILTLIAMVTSGLNLNAQSKKALIVYYSWGGNTREIAEQIKSITGAEILEIVPANAYPGDYDECVDQAKKEINSDFRPAIKTKINNLKDYDVIYVGSPNWWSTIAPPVATFLSENDLSGKTVVPFITHGGGGKAKCFTDMQKLCSGATITEGLAIRDSRSKSSKAEVENWLKEINMIK